MRALVLSGGGSKGQYHVGVLQALVHDLKRSYDIYCGVSVGALVGSFMAQFKDDEVKTGVDQLTRLFLSVHTKDIYRNWFLVRELAAFWEESLYDSSPLLNLIRKHLSEDAVRASGKKLRIGATSLSSGRYHVFDESTLELHEAVYASACYPVAFEPIHFRDQVWVDGGIRSVTPITAAFEAGATEIDVVIVSPDKSSQRFEADPNALSIALRSVELMNDQIVEDDVKKAELYNRLLGAGVDCGGKRPAEIRVIRPQYPLLDNALRFDPEEARRLQETGYRDALAAFGAP